MSRAARWNLARSTPLRLTAVLIAVFALSTLVSFGIAYGVIRRSSDAALRVQSVQEFGSYRRMASQGQLVNRLLNEAVTIPPKSLILHYRSDTGTVVTNVPGLPPLSNGSVVLPGEIPLPGETLADSYLVISGRAGQGDLTLARNREHIARLWEIFSIVALISLVPTLLVGSVTGLAMARGAARRVETVRATLTDLTLGRLDARVAGAHGGDDLGQIGDAVNRMAEAQGAAAASLRQVSADIAHDLKTPIQRVSVLLDQLGEDALSPSQQEIVSRARAETGQIVRTFQSLLQIAQMEGGQARAGFAAVDLGQVVGGVVDVYEPAVEETGHVLAWTPPAGPRKVTGERNLLGQVAANLIENALRHTPPGTAIEVAVEEAAPGEAGVGEGGAGAVGARRAGAEKASLGVVLTVRDRGPGVPEGERDHVLRRLYRLERSRTSEGSGLGLSLVAAICDLHGARLTLSDNAPGLVVRIAFPEAPAERRAPARRSSAPGGAAPTVEAPR